MIEENARQIILRCALQEERRLRRVRNMAKLLILNGFVSLSIVGVAVFLWKTSTDALWIHFFLVLGAILILFGGFIIKGSSKNSFKELTDEEKRLL